jgi:hypothetical protein
VWFCARGHRHDGEHRDVGIAHHNSLGDGQRRAAVEQGLRQRCGLDGVDGVRSLVFGELHGTLGKLLVTERGTERVPMKLSMVAWWWWQMATRCWASQLTGKEGEKVNEVRHSLKQVITEEGLLYGVSSLVDPDYIAYPLKMTSATLNLRISQQLKY